MTRIMLLCLTAATLSACTNPEIGVAPAFSPINYGYKPVGLSASGYPAQPSDAVKRFSLWDDRQSRLFTDPRAISQGDILTVLISIDDEAKLKNETGRSRTAKRDMGLTGSYAFGARGSSASGNLGANGDSTFDGTGATTRSEDIKLSMAAVVIGVLPNGNLAIRGSQEVRVNDELRVLTIAGVVRPGDIGANNTISYDRIAEARISYGGRGTISEIQKPSYGQQLADHYSPF